MASSIGTGKAAGWSSAVVSSSTSKGDYLIFPSYDSLSEDSGTIELRLIRRNVRPIETLFTLVDDHGKPLLMAQVFWDGTFAKGLPEINFEGIMSDRLWSSDWSDPRFGQSRVVASTLPLGEPIVPGGVLHIAMTWGPEEENCAFHLNGRTLPIVVPQPFGMAEILERTSRLVVGAEPIQGTDGGYEHLNSPLLFLRTYDEPVNPFVPVIHSVRHNGFQVAGYSGKLVAGDPVTVTLKGDAYQRASFDLSHHKDVPMNEIPGAPGTYTGSLTIGWSDGEIQEAMVGHLVSSEGLEAIPIPSERTVEVDARAFTVVKVAEEILPADENSSSDVTAITTNANGNAIQGHELKLTMSTTDEYTGLAGSGVFKDVVGSELDVDWGGITDSFGAVTAQYISGFAAKTILVSAKNMTSGDVGVGYVRSFIDGSVDIVVTELKVRALSVAGSMDISLSREWLTADGRSRSRITAVIRGAEGQPVSGHTVRFTLLGHNGSIRVIQGKTDSRGRAIADYIAGIVMGQVQVEVRDLTSGMVAVVPVELRPDAPAEIALSAEPGEVMAGGETKVTARVTDANGNPNSSVDVLYEIAVGTGELSSASVATDDEGIAAAVFTAGNSSGVVTVRGTVTSRVPTHDEISAAEGAVFLYGLDEDPGRLDVIDWLVKTGDEVMEGQELVLMEDRVDTVYTVMAPRDGIMSVFTAEERDRVEYGDTLGYILDVSE
jgi:biotin carboxyl carrier protein